MTGTTDYAFDIDVDSRFLDEESAPDEGRFVFAYTIHIRNRGTVGGNLGSASPAGDAHPPLIASRAVVEVGSVRGARRVPVRDFFTGVKRSVLEPDELIRAVHVPVAATTVRARNSPWEAVRWKKGAGASTASTVSTVTPC